jgi:hypothetical protein
VGVLRRIADGVVIAEAEGFVGDDELDRKGQPIWGKRAMYARMAMAQTRAISRVCRSAFAFVVVLIDEKLSTTPAEEMSDDDLTPEPADVPPHPDKAPGLRTTSVNHQYMEVDKAKDRAEFEAFDKFAMAVAAAQTQADLEHIAKATKGLFTGKLREEAGALWKAKEADLKAKAEPKVQLTQAQADMAKQAGLVLGVKS